MTAKRLISFILSLAMCASIININAAALESIVNSDEKTESVSVNAADKSPESENISEDTQVFGNEISNDGIVADSEKTDNSQAELADSEPSGEPSDIITEIAEPEEIPEEISTDTPAEEKESSPAQEDDNPAKTEIPADNADVSSPDVVEPKNDENTEKEQYIVVYNSTAACMSDFSFRASAGSIDSRLSYDVMELTEQDAQELAASDEVAYIEKDHETSAFENDIPEDELEQSSLSAESENQLMSWGYRYTGAHAISKKYQGQGVKIAVLDSGVGPHEDLTVAGGASFVDYTSSYNDDNGHGTHVAGIIAAHDNDIGIVGVAPKADIYSVKVLDSDGHGNYSSLINGIEWAIDNDMDIINLSLGGSEASRALENAIRRASNAGIIVIAAAGNYGPTSNTVRYPAKYQAATAVASIDKYLYVSGFSSRGTEIDIAAPGSNVESLSISGSSYETRNGTSQAAPFVAAAAAVLLSKNPQAAPDEIINAIYSTAYTAITTDQSCVGHGYVNIPAALGSISETADIPESENPDNSFDESADYDIRVNQYKEKLKIYRDNALKEGQTELSKEINQCLEEVIQNDIAIRGLSQDGENINSSKYNTSDSSKQSYSNVSFYENSDLLYELEDYCRQTIQTFSPRFANSALHDPGGTDSQSTGQIISENTPMDINSSGQQLFEFTPSRDGIYIISTDYYNNGSVENDTCLEMFDNQNLEDTDRIAYNDDSRGSLFATIEKQLRAGTTYYILLTNYSDGQPLCTRLEITCDFPDILCGGYKDISAGAGEYMAYRFIPSESAEYTIKTGRYGDTGAYNDTIIGLYQNSNLTDPVAVSRSSESDGFASITYELSGGTAYYIKVSHSDGESGKIHARLTINKSVGIQRLSAGDSVHAQINSNEYAAYCFTPSKTAVYKIATSSGSGYNDTYLELYLDDCLTERIAFNDDSGNSPLASIIYQLDKNTKYYIKLSGYTGGKVNADISIEKEAEAVYEVHTNSQTSVYAPQGGYVLYKFTPDDSGIYTIETSSAGISEDTVIQLYSGIQMENLVARDDDGGQSTLSKITHSLTAGNSYFIKISGYNSSAVNVNLSVIK